MKCATTVVTLLVLGLMTASSAQAQTHWIDWGYPDLDIENAERIIVAEKIRVMVPPLVVLESSTQLIPPGTYHPYKVWVHPAGGGRPVSTIGLFLESPNIHGMYNMTLSDRFDLVYDEHGESVYAYDAFVRSSFKPSDN